MKTDFLNKPKRFWFHYNKPESKKTGKPKITLHFNKKCHIIDNLVCNVRTEGKINKVQPVFVMQGMYEEISIVNNIAYII